MTMGPEDYITLTGASYRDIADLCERSYSEVCRWFSQGRCHREPTRRDRKILLLHYMLLTYEDRNTNGAVSSHLAGLVSPQTATLG